MHIYYGGDLCLPMINPLHYVTSTTLWDVVTGIDNMLHLEPNPADPANLDIRT